MLERGERTVAIGERTDDRELNAARLLRPIGDPARTRCSDEPIDRRGSPWLFDEGRARTRCSDRRRLTSTARALDFGGVTTMKILVVAASQVLDNPLLSNTERACSLEASVTETAKGRRCFGVRVLERGRTGERTVAIGDRSAGSHAVTLAASYTCWGRAMARSSSR